MTKLISFNKASRITKAGVLAPYLYEQEYETLTEIVGLKQTEIDYLYNQIVVKGKIPGTERFLEGGEREDYIKELYGNIDFNSLNIPGDLSKTPLIIGDDGQITSGILNAPGIGKVKFGWQYGKIPTTNIYGQPVTPIVNFNEQLFGSIRTAPSTNRWWTLWDSYGGFRSIIMRLLLDKLNYYGGRAEIWNLVRFAPDSTGRFLDPAVADTLKQKKIQAGVKRDYGATLPPKLPFGTQGGGEYGTFFWTNMMASLVWPESWIEVSELFGGGVFIDKSVIENSRLIDQLNGGLQFPILGNTFNPNPAWIYLRGSYGRTQLGAGAGRVINPEDAKLVGWTFQGAFSGPWYGESSWTENAPIRVRTPSGVIIVRGNPNPGAPWIEFPNVKSPQGILEPQNIPIGMAAVYGDIEPLLDFNVDLNLHFDAIAEWVEAGCPCDWPQWGDYKDPVTQSLEKQQEAINISTANKYVPVVTTSSAPPNNPNFGDLWRDSTTGVTKVFTKTSSTTGTWVDQ